MYIASRKSPRNNSYRISEAEFKLTSQIMFLFGIYPGDDYELYIDYLDKNQFCIPLSDIRAKPIAYAERYSSISSIPMSVSIFRPFKSDKHADIIIRVFDELNKIDYDTIETIEISSNEKTRYSGWLTKDGVKIEGSLIKTAPSIPILKMSIMASLLMDENEHAEYMKNLKELLGDSYDETDTNT